MKIPLEDARSILMSVASEHDFIFEKDVDKLVKEIMQAFAANDGSVGPNSSRHAISIYRQLSSGHVSEREAKRRLKQMMLDNDWKPGRSNLFPPDRHAQVVPGDGLSDEFVSESVALSPGVF